VGTARDWRVELLLLLTMKFALNRRLFLKRVALAAGASHVLTFPRLLTAAGADLVVTTLDDVDPIALSEGRLATRKT